MAWLAPFEPVGYMACAASPSSATGPSTQVGTGSRSIIGFSKANPRPDQGRNIEPVPGPLLEVMREFDEGHLAEPAALLPALALSSVTSAIQLMIERPVCGSGCEIG